MKCHKIADWLREHPGGQLPPELRQHLSACPCCAQLWEAQSALENTLGRLAPDEPPPLLKQRILAAIRQQGAAPATFLPYPVWAALVFILALFLVWSYLRLPADLPTKPSLAQNQTETILTSDTETSAPPPGTADDPSIYPVWPKSEDAVLAQDLQILASIYPAPQSGSRVEVAIDDQDLSAMAVIKGELVSLIPEGLKPGQHRLELRLCKGRKVLNSSKITFYLVEAPS